MSESPSRPKPSFERLARVRHRRLPLYERPRTRGDCAGVSRPCHFVACKFNLFSDFLEPTEATPDGQLKWNYPHPGDMPRDASCALDVADRGEHTLEEIATVMRISDEWVRQISWAALAKLEQRGGAHLRAVAEADQRTEDPIMAAKKKKALGAMVPKGAVERGRRSDKLPVPIEADVVKERALEMAKTIHAYNATLEEKREANAVYREKLSHFKEKLKEQAYAVEEGKELREVELVLYLLPTNEVQWVRTDTGEVVESRAATSDELQEKLPEVEDDDPEKNWTPEMKAAIHGNGEDKPAPKRRGRPPKVKPFAGPTAGPPAGLVG